MQLLMQTKWEEAALAKHEARLNLAMEEYKRCNMINVPGPATSGSTGSTGTGIAGTLSNIASNISSGLSSLFSGSGSGGGSGGGGGSQSATAKKQFPWWIVIAAGLGIVLYSANKK